MARYRPVSKFKSYSHQALITEATNVYNGMVDNPKFNNPPVTMAELTAANTALQLALTNCGDSLPNCTLSNSSILNERIPIVLNMLGRLQNYVTEVADGNLDVIISSGMEVEALPD